MNICYKESRPTIATIEQEAVVNDVIQRLDESNFCFKAKYVSKTVTQAIEQEVSSWRKYAHEYLSRKLTREQILDSTQQSTHGIHIDGTLDIFVGSDGELTAQFRPFRRL